MKIYYGTPIKYIDITDKIFQLYEKLELNEKKNNQYIIPCDDLIRSNLFGDPLPYVLKHIMIEENDKYKVYHPGQQVIINMPVNLLTCNKKIVIYTCIYGNYDDLTTSIKQDIDCDYICLTDDEKLKSDIFKVIIYKPLDYYENKHLIQKQNENIMNTMLCRSNLFLLEPLKKYDICIYIDANMSMDKPNTISNILKNSISNKLMILSKHNERNCVYKEAMFCLNRIKFNNIDLINQMKKYKVESYYENNGLYWNGFVLYLNPFSEEMKIFYELYTMESFLSVKNHNLKYHFQGQVTLPYVLWKSNIEDKIQVVEKHYMSIISFKQHKGSIIISLPPPISIALPST